MTDSATHELLAFDLADRLHKALRIANCKPGEMRVILGVSPSTMTNYLKGDTRPKDGMLRQWALRCAVPADWLIHGTEQSPGDPGGQENAPTKWYGADVIPLRARRDAPSRVAA